VPISSFFIMVAGCLRARGRVFPIVPAQVGNVSGMQAAQFGAIPTLLHGGYKTISKNQVDAT
jgi:hypothetical protein